MVDQDPIRGDNDGLFYLDSVVYLLSYSTLEEMLPEALSRLVNLFQAAGGKLGYTSAFSYSIQIGHLSQAALDEIAYWEKVFDERARMRGWERQFPELLPVSRHLLPDDQGTLFNAPLIVHDRLFGFVALAFSSPRCLTPHEELGLAKMAWAICAVAEKLELIALSRQRLSQLGLFYQMGQVMNATFDVNRLLSDTIQLALTVIDAQAAILMLMDEEHQELAYEVSLRGTPPSKRMSLDKGIVGWTVRHNEPVFVNDVTQDRRFDPQADGCVEHPTTSLLCAPLSIKGRVAGAIQVINKAAPFEFGQEDLSVLLTLITQAAIALDNARLYNSLRTEHDRIIQAQENVRRQLARDLHDGPAQILAALSMGLDHLEKLSKLKPEEVWGEIQSLQQLTKQAMQETRTMLFALRPVILETQGLVPAIQSYVERLSATARFSLHFDGGHFDRRLDINVEGAIFSILQEAVNNVGKHANAQNVWIELREENGELVLKVEDDGEGFDVRSIQNEYDQSDSFGLLNMRERAELIGGVLTLESGPHRKKQGTLVQLRVKLPDVKELQNERAADQPS